MNTTIRTLDETRLAQEIVSVLQPAALRACSDDPQTICYAVRSSSLRLRSIVLDRDALRRLLQEADGWVKVEYLKRDLLRSAAHRCEYRYPRRSMSGVRSSAEPKRARAAL